MTDEPPPVLVLMLDHTTTTEPSDVLAASDDVEKLVDHARAEDLAAPAGRLREIGTSVPILGDGDEVRIEEVPLL